MTRHLLDTHALIWWWNEPERISPRATAILDGDDEILVSAVSGIEIAIKVRLGQLPMMEGRIGDFEDALHADRFRQLPITHAHAVKAGLMAGAHRDPFDRILAAQGMIEGLTVVTRDRQIAAFGCETLW